ncbi:MAG: hypothetical protein ACRDJV_04355 [Actinomycetota bacterium]
MGSDRRRLVKWLVVLMLVFPLTGVACEGEARVETDSGERESKDNGGGEGEGGADVEVETE